MGLRKLFIMLTVTLTIIFGLMLGSSYAWYAYTNAESSLFGKTLDEKPTVIFAQDDSVMFRANIPILDSDRYSYANITSFNVTFGENVVDYDAAVSIELYDIVIDPALVIDNFKYELLENGVSVATGSFASYENTGNMMVMPAKLIEIDEYPKTYVYDLFVWLSDDGTDQNDLMDKNFSAKVRVNNALKRK